MRRIVILDIILLVAITALILTALWYIEFYQSGNSSVSGMMGQMMGGGTNNASHPMPQSVLALLIFLIAVAVLAIGGVAYYLIAPEIRTEGELLPAAPIQSDETVSTIVSQQMKPKEESAVSRQVSWPVLIRTSKPEEKKVLEVLSAHGGKYLQKLIVKESGLSKLKIHRILSRFVERGIVTVSKSGNTNEIELANWLQSNKDAK